MAVSHQLGDVAHLPSLFAFTIQLGPSPIAIIHIVLSTQTCPSVPEPPGTKTQLVGLRTSRLVYVVPNILYHVVAEGVAPSTSPKTSGNSSHDLFSRCMSPYFNIFLGRPY